MGTSLPRADALITAGFAPFLNVNITVCIELPITDGYNVLDDNLLACSEKHIHDVFDMLKRQKEKPIFTGGIEAKILKS